MADMPSETVRSVCARVLELRDLNRAQWQERGRVRDIMNNRQALQALIGKRIKDPEARLPIANMMLVQNSRLAQKLGRPADIKVDPPISADSDPARERAEKRGRIVTSLDRASRLTMLLPQVGRWLPGYGFVAAVIRQGTDRNGDPFPHVELRDPYHTFLGEYGPNQQPPDMSCIYTMARSKLVDLFPEKRNEIMGYRTSGRGILLDGGGSGAGGTRSIGWSSQSGSGVDVYEYYDKRGCWWVIPDGNVLLSYVPNLLSGPQFLVAKRFCFDELIGALDHGIGIMANMARLALLDMIATEDSVLAELWITGDIRGGEVKRGRNSVNYLTQGSSVQRLNSQVPAHVSQQLNGYERQLRLVTGHPVAEDGESPNSFATGAGIQELRSGNSLEVREYQTVLEAFLEDLDSKRLEWLQVYYGDRKLSMVGVEKGAPFSETYTPAKDIKGDYLTRRTYGAMASWDDSTKIVTLLQLLAANVIDVDTFREHLDGFENLQRIRERVRGNEAERAAFEALLAQVQQGEPKAMEAAIKLLAPGEMRDVLEEVFLSQPAAPAAAPGASPAGPPPDLQSVLSGLGAHGQPQGGVQTMTRVA